MARAYAVIRGGDEEVSRIRQEDHEPDGEDECADDGGKGMAIEGDEEVLLRQGPALGGESHGERD